jgi:hypothetical protein
VREAWFRKGEGGFFSEQGIGEVLSSRAAGNTDSLIGVPTHTRVFMTSRKSRTIEFHEEIRWIEGLG